MGEPLALEAASSTAVFEPPTIPGYPVTGRNAAATELFRRVPTVQGRNIFILVDGTVTTIQPPDWSTVARFLLGGHLEPVTVAEEALLVAAGFGAHITHQDLLTTESGDLILTDGP